MKEEKKNLKLMIRIFNFVCLIEELMQIYLLVIQQQCHAKLNRYKPIPTTYFVFLFYVHF